MGIVRPSAPIDLCGQVLPSLNRPRAVSVQKQNDSKWSAYRCRTDWIQRRWHAWFRADWRTLINFYPSLEKSQEPERSSSLARSRLQVGSHLYFGPFYILSLSCSWLGLSFFTSVWWFPYFAKSHVREETAAGTSRSRGNGLLQCYGGRRRIRLCASVLEPAGAMSAKRCQQ